jgi:putative aminopeptidase FrvX
MDFSLLKTLTETPGVSGREERVRAIVADQFSGLTEQVTVDAMGNLIGHIAGKGPRVALIAHMDEIGFLVSKIEPEGFVRVMPVGGIDSRIFPAQQVVVHGREDLPGIVGSVPPHLMKDEGKEAGKAPPIEEGFIDLGLPSDKISELVKIGDPVSFATRSWENEISFFGKALDDRAGLFVMLEAVRQASGIDANLFLIASTQEEYGLRGVGPAVHAVHPDIAIALEGTVASDTPGLNLPANTTPTGQGKGPEIRLTDRRMIADRDLANYLIGLAQAKGIPHQVIVKQTGATDAAAGQVTASGVRAGAVSVPARYIHTPAAMVRKSDVVHTIALVRAFVETASQFGSPPGL